MHFLRIQLLLLLVSCLPFSARAQDDLDVIHGKNQWLQYTDAKNALYQHFSKEAFDHLQKRKQYVAQTQTQEQWKQRQEWIKRSLHEVVGTFPARTPLNARVVRTITMDGYRVEHVLFESRPGFYVTSSLYVPGTLRKKEKAPAIIYCSGHATEGYRSDVYQHVILNLVKKGFIVFAFDPVGQGERLEYFDPATNKSRAGGPTSEHSYPGSQAFITGSSQANYMIWDGIRAVDYLLTRKEVDASRIGITGRSGGGTQSAYIAAFDDRIHAVAPENYITNFTRLLESIGPQDAEQNFARAISEGLDHGDLLIVRAPKPALMITTTRDMFSIQGARETADEVSRVYESFGSQSAFGMVEDDAPHASTKKNREAMYAFFREHLKNPGQTTDEQIALAAHVRASGNRLQISVLDWCLQNAVPLRALEPDWLVVSYEQLVMDPATVVSHLAERLDLRDPARMLARIDRASASTTKSSLESRRLLDEARGDESAREQRLIGRWRERIGEADAARAFDILEAFGITFYVRGALMPSPSVLLPRRIS